MCIRDRFQTVNLPVLNGTHVVYADWKPDAGALPSVGVTAYGFDHYVSYGYTGGLDLNPIVVGVNPGG